MPPQSRHQSGLDGARAHCSENSEAGPDAATMVCSEWLPRYSEQEQLTVRWQALETRLFRDHNWCQLSEAQRKSLPQAAQFDAMNHQIERLHRLNRKQLKTVTGLSAKTVHGLVCKLSVALALVPPDENEDAHDLLRSILKDVEAL